MSASRHQLGAEWQNAFLTAPVWRFWLGADIAGTTVAGAIMPSVDGVGRYYPLTLLAMADPSYSIPPPDLDAQDQWFTAAEEFLLSTLNQAKSFEDISAALDTMPAPLMAASVSNSNEVLTIGDTMVGAVTAGKTFPDSMPCSVKTIMDLRRQRASGGRKAEEIFLRWRSARGACRIRSGIRSC